MARATLTPAQKTALQSALAQGFEKAFDANIPRKVAFAKVANYIGQSGKRVSDVLTNDEIGQVLNNIDNIRTSRAVGKLNF